MAPVEITDKDLKKLSKMLRKGTSAKADDEIMGADALKEAAEADSSIDLHEMFTILADAKKAANIAVFKAYGAMAIGVGTAVVGFATMFMGMPEVGLGIFAAGMLMTGAAALVSSQEEKDLHKISTEQRFKITDHSFA
jgi:hypothetical protein